MGTSEAEGEGFEPSVRLRAQRFSRPPRSTTPAPLQGPVTGTAKGSPSGRFPPGAAAQFLDAAQRLGLGVPDAQRVLEPGDPDRQARPSVGADDGRPEPRPR